MKLNFYIKEIEKAYAYDKRGNLSLIMENGALKNRYVYGALNRLEQAVNAKGETALYTYNGLGHRVGKTTGTIHPEKKIQYTIDLTRSYHNLLQKEEDGNTQSYLWDRNVAGMTEDGQGRYYLQDEMGSPIRLMDKDGELEDSYGYDEFGQDLYGNQGTVQPFGYTGYQADRIAGTYYAQAREYRAELGRFAAVDTIKGFTAAPYTLNEYGYCWNNPIGLIDANGLLPQWIVDIIDRYGGELPEWLERIIEGDEAHRLLKEQFIKDYGKSGGVAEYYIPFGVDRNPSGTGKADIIYFNAETGIAEVYEIKPLVTYGPVLKYNNQGRAQMEGYVSALNRIQKQWTAKPGTTLNEYFNKTVIDSEMYEGKEIVYHVFQDGMITYYYRDKKPEKERVAVPKDAKEKLKEIYRSLGIAWEKNKDLVRILTIIVCVVVFFIACVVSGGSVFLGAAALLLLFVLWENNNVLEQEECVEA